MDLKNIMKGILFFYIAMYITLALNSYGHALCVNVSDANLRSGPGTQYEKTWEVFKYMPFKKITQKGAWYKVKDVDGDEHWIYKKLVTSKFKCAVVKKNNINIRTGPGRNFNTTLLSPAVTYDSFKIIKARDSWVNVVDEFGNNGWIFKQLLWIQ
ncbi:MAG TPA: hypothetical protein DDX85_02310 [Nitrospiraceae bacterium]|nr:hypothetical protein [Nitrospiraceae bacterium]